MRTPKAVAFTLVAVFVSSSLSKAAAPAGRFTLTTDTVTDVVTQLVWQRAVPATSFSWDGAKAYCQGLSVGGFTSGWRVPSIKELSSIVDHRSMDPAIDSTVFPNTPWTAFWTSSAFAKTGSTPQAWTVNLSEGDATLDFVTSLNRVRCVR